MIEEGLRHITDLKGYDHLLLLLTLVSPYFLKEWQKWLLLVSIFTLGHTLSLFLSSSGYFRLDSGLVEFLIPVTILITALYNSFLKKSKSISRIELLAVLVIGLIHGFGFSGYFGMLVRDYTFYSDLFLFSLGIELGQIIIVVATLLFGYFVQKIPGVTKGYFVYTLNLIAIILSAQLAYQNWPF